VFAVDLDASSLDICQNFAKRQPIFLIKSPHIRHVFLFLDVIFLQKALKDQSEIICTLAIEDGILYPFFEIFNVGVKRECVWVFVTHSFLASFKSS
jgi:hypothetical protein